MTRRRAFPWVLAAAAAAGLYLVMHPASAKPSGGWIKKSDGWLGTGGRYRWSTPRYGTMSASAIASALADQGFTGITVWQDTIPADWPAEDRAAGRNHIELTATAPQWIGDSVEVWAATPFSGTMAAPSDRTRGNRLALLAQGTVR